MAQQQEGGTIHSIAPEHHPAGCACGSCGHEILLAPHPAPPVRDDVAGGTIHSIAPQYHPAGCACGDCDHEIRLALESPISSSSDEQQEEQEQIPFPVPGEEDDFGGPPDIQMPGSRSAAKFESVSFGPADFTEGGKLKPARSLKWKEMGFTVGRAAEDLWRKGGGQKTIEIFSTTLHITVTP